MRKIYALHYALMALGVTAAGAGLPMVAHGFGLPGGLGGAVGGGGGSGAQVVAPATLTGQLSDLNSTFQASWYNIDEARKITFDALGDKKNADKYEAEATAVKSGNIMDKDQVATLVSTESGATVDIQNDEAKIPSLSASGKAKLALAVPFYTLGTVNAATLPGKYATWASQAQDTAKSFQGNPAAMASNSSFIAQVPQVVNISAQIPGLFQKWIDSTKNFVSYTKSQKVDVDLSKIPNI